MRASRFGVADDIRPADLLPGGEVVGEHRGRPAPDEEPMAGFVERHRVVGAGRGHRPGRGHLHRHSVDDGDLSGVRHVDEDPRAFAFELKRLRVRGELDDGGDLAACRVDGGQRAAAVSDVEAFRARVVPRIVGVVAQTDGRDRVKIVCVDQLQALARAVGHRNRRPIGHAANPLRLVESRQAAKVGAILHVDHFDGVVGERSDEQLVAGCIQRQMVHPSFDARQLDGSNERQ